jgi:hypothetical protein
VAQQRPKRPHLRRGDPRFEQQIGAQRLGQDRRVHLVFFSRAEAMAGLAPQWVHQVRSNP